MFFFFNLLNAAQETYLFFTKVKSVKIEIFLFHNIKKEPFTTQINIFKNMVTETNLRERIKIICVKSI